MITSPPFPPSPPSGPPKGTNFSRRKVIAPSPPLPAFTLISVKSNINVMVHQISNLFYVRWRRPILIIRFLAAQQALNKEQKIDKDVLAESNKIKLSKGNAGY
jgi:hypothetical protein